MWRQEKTRRLDGESRLVVDTGQYKKCNARFWGQLAAIDYRFGVKLRSRLGKMKKNKGKGKSLMDGDLQYLVEYPNPRLRPTYSHEELGEISPMARKE